MAERKRPATRKSSSAVKAIGVKKKQATAKKTVSVTEPIESENKASVINETESTSMDVADEQVTTAATETAATEKTKKTTSTTKATATKKEKLTPENTTLEIASVTQAVNLEKIEEKIEEKTACTPNNSPPATKEMGMFLQDPTLSKLRDNYLFPLDKDYLVGTSSSRFTISDTNEKGEPVFTTPDWSKQEDLSFESFQQNGLVDNPEFHQVNVFAYPLGKSG
ncbi:hypothetical protein [Brunnivagina elsteri]|uniref:Uncharacterized protein n=1 Tax=Brunnivagina elsteri CCALA 953 TaxID=987040 RepID=A0A2A2TFM2_9CYAN|nr:hypothetical protein [Calothrix elsteri]PAX52597.1 hypothetical protein CK510_18400 [Calothrix elsteri CCALA 953]